MSGAAALSSSLGDEVDRQLDVVPRFLARTAALLLTRDAVRTAFARLVGRALALKTWARVGGVCMFSGNGVSVEGGASKGEGKGSVAVVAAKPNVGSAGGGHLPAASLLLSSCRLTLPARSLLLFPDGFLWAAALVAETPPFALGLNQKETSSIAPSVSKTNLAGIPSLLQHTHAMY